jgi:hypothetical protein
MILFWPLFTVVYLGIVLVVVYILNKFSRKIPVRPAIIGGLIGSTVMFLTIMLAATLFSLKESFWHEGPAWRFDLLSSTTALLSIAGLIGGPIYWVMRNRRKQP